MIRRLQGKGCAVDIPAVDFLAGGVLTLTIAVGTTLVLVLKAAGASPVDSLHQE